VKNQWARRESNPQSNRSKSDKGGTTAWKSGRLAKPVGAGRRQSSLQRSSVAVHRISIEPSGLTVPISERKVRALIVGHLRAYRYAGKLRVSPSDLATALVA
jgi:hypothetical protein